MENLEFGKKKLNLYPVFSHIKNTGVLIIPLGTDNEKNDGEWLGLISASLQEFYFTITASVGFFSGSRPVLYFLGGREGGGLRGGRRILLLQS